MPVSHPPRVTAILSGLNPSSILGVLKPLMVLERQGAIRFRLVLEAYFGRASLRQTDLVVFCRNLEPRYAHVLEAVQAQGIPYIYDLDDNLFDVPPGTEDGAYYNDPARQALLVRYLRGATRVRVYAAPLETRIRALNPKVERLIPPLDWELIAPSAAAPAAPVKIVYATSRRADHLYPIFEPALLEALRRYAGQVEVTFWGFQPSTFQGLPGVTYRPFTSNYNRYLREFSSLGFEIGLAPLLDDDFHRSKTNLKFREYGACGIAGIYSNVSVYSESVEDGRTGLLVENTTADWLAALARLIEDPALRRAIGQNARQTALERFSPAAFDAAWLRQIEAALSAPLTPSPLSPAGRGEQEERPASSPSLLEKGSGERGRTVWPSSPRRGEEGQEERPASSPSLLEKGSGERGRTASPPSPRRGEGGRGDEGPARPPSTLSLWLEKLRRAAQLARAGDWQHYGLYSRAHLNNLWWLFKINRLKRL